MGYIPRRCTAANTLRSMLRPCVLSNAVVACRLTPDSVPSTRRRDVPTQLLHQSSIPHRHPPTASKVRPNLLPWQSPWMNVYRGFRQRLRCRSRRQSHRHRRYQLAVETVMYLRLQTNRLQLISWARSMPRRVVSTCLQNLVLLPRCSKELYQCRLLLLSILARGPRLTKQ